MPFKDFLNLLTLFLTLQAASDAEQEFSSKTSDASVTNDLLDQECVEEKLLPMWTLPAPTYHWASWDGHTGGVNCLHIDSFGLVASNACRHRVTTRCIERGDESKKDNLLIYDFWQPGTDARRTQFAIST